jgi:hypothetical protein
MSLLAFCVLTSENNVDVLVYVVAYTMEESW